MKTLEQLYDRFKLDLEIMKQLQVDIITIRANEDDLKSIIYHLGELKAIHEGSLHEQ